MERGRRLDVAWEASGAAHSPERSWIRTLVYGTVRLRGRLDHLIAHACSRRPARLDPEVLAALRMGAHQILFMGGVPAYAAVSEAVDQVKRSRRRAAAGLVNATLRRIAALEEPKSLFPDPKRDLEGYLSTWGSHPAWLVRRWIAAFGPGAARGLVEANNREPSVYLRPVGVAPEIAIARLMRDGFLVKSTGDAAPPPLTPSARPSGRARGRASAANPAPAPFTGPCIELAPGADPGAALSLTPGVIQDPAASLVVDYAAPPPGAVIADLCAAPGGKALALAASASRVLAADRSLTRLSRVQAAVRRLEASDKVSVVAADARRPPVRRADMVLADVPCSGTGTLRRHPDGKWRVTEHGIREMAALQRSILDGAASVVPRGGLLVYATCALEHEENGGQVKDFLMRNPDFRIEAGPTGTVPQRFLDRKGCLSVLPHESGFDGAFAARLRRLGA